MDLLKIISETMFHPSKFFKGLKKEKGLSKAWKYFAIIALISFVLTTISSYFTQEIIEAFISTLLEVPPEEPASAAALIGFGFLGYLFSIGWVFAWAGIAHLWFMLWGAKNIPYEKTFQLTVYNKTPMYLLSWIPFLNYLVWAWTVVIGVIGVQQTHKLSKGRAIGAYLTAVGMYVMFLAIVFVIAAAFYAITDPTFFY
jgi:hypothetical protein